MKKENIERMLTFKKLEGFYEQAKKFSGCEHIGKKRCGKDVLYFYFADGKIIHQSCSQHKLKEDTKHSKHCIKLACKGECKK